MSNLLYVISNVKVILDFSETLMPTIGSMIVEGELTYFGNCLGRETYSRLALYIFGRSILKSLREAWDPFKGCQMMIDEASWQ